VSDGAARILLASFNNPGGLEDLVPRSGAHRVSRTDAGMIQLTRLDKTELYINPDLLRSAEAVPDTMITLTTGERLYVSESLEEVRARFVAYQRAIRRERAQDVLAPAVPLASDGPMAERAARGGPQQQGAS
jgi:flagellar protein FlbD